MSDHKPREFAHKPTTAEKREMGRGRRTLMAQFERARPPP